MPKALVNEHKSCQSTYDPITVIATLVSLVLFKA